MKLEVAQLINKELHTYAIEALEAYAQYKIEHYYKLLENCKADELPRHQGAISELRKLSKIRDDAQAVLEQAKNVKTSNPSIHRG